MLLYLARRSYTCTHTNTHTCTAEANTQTDVGGFFFVKWDTSSIVAAIKATTPRAGTQKEF